jgi:adenosylcobinamide-GDP ribazoletransferase
VLDAPRHSLGLLTVVPVGRLPALDRRIAGRAMLWSPVVGLVLALLSAAVVRLSLAAGHPRLLAAALGLAVLAAATRGLHLDGLADTADGLGSGRPPADALAVMRTGDVGPFGVATLTLTLLVQAAALAAAGPHALLVAVPVGRLATVWACRRGVPAARDEGLGALVASTVGTTPLLAVTAVALAASGAIGWHGPVAVLAGLAGGMLLLQRCVRRLGGVTGDVLGAVCETATTAALLVLATS